MKIIGGEYFNFCMGFLLIIIILIGEQIKFSFH